MLLRRTQVHLRNSDSSTSHVIFYFPKQVQYIFDRSFEISYKLIIGQKAYTVFEADETGDYYELDAPEYIQLKVQNIVPKVILVSISSYKYMEDKGYINDDYASWLFPFLFGASSIAMSYALEMDMNDDSEMEQYLKDH